MPEHRQLSRDAVCTATASCNAEMGTTIVTDNELRDGVTGRPPRGSWVYHLLRPVMITLFTMLVSMLILPFANGSTPGVPGDILSYHSSTRSWTVDTTPAAEKLKDNLCVRPRELQSPRSGDLTQSDPFPWGPRLSGHVEPGWLPDEPPVT